MKKGTELHLLGLCFFYPGFLKWSCNAALCRESFLSCASIQSFSYLKYTLYHCLTLAKIYSCNHIRTHACMHACMHARTHTVNKYRVQWHTHAHLLGTKCLISFFSGTSQVMTCWRPGVTKLSHALTHRHTICPGRDGSRWRARSVLKFWLGIYNLQE